MEEVVGGPGVVVAGREVVVVIDDVAGAAVVVAVIKEVVEGAGVVVVVGTEVVVVVEEVVDSGVVVVVGTEVVVVVEEVVDSGVVVVVVIKEVEDIDPFLFDENGAGVDTMGMGDVELVPLPSPPPDCGLASRLVLRTWRASVFAVTTLLTCAPDTPPQDISNTASASTQAIHEHHRNLFTFLCFLGMPRRIPCSHGLYTRPLLLALSRC